MSQERLLELFQGNDGAVKLMLMLHELSHTWDDLIDQDATDKRINRAFWIAVVGLGTNPFYRQFQDILLPVLESGIFNYVASNELERFQGESRIVAHCARYAVGDVALTIMRLIGGLDWAMEHAAEVKMLLNADSFDSFNLEMEAKHGTKDLPAA